MNVIKKAKMYIKAILAGQVALSDKPTLLNKVLYKAQRATQLKLSRIVLKFEARFSGVIIRTSRNPQYIDAAVIWPKKHRRFYLTNVRSGNYHLKIEHSDSFIFAKRKSLLAHFELSNDKINTVLARRMKLIVGDYGRAFAYLGGGSKRNGTIYQHISFSVPTDQRWLRITLSSSYDRVINLDRIIFKQQLGDELVPAYIRVAVDKWLDGCHDVIAAEFLLYADIDLNIIDGSSVWLSSMASLLCALGKCVLVAKADIRTDVIRSNIRHRDNLIILEPSALGKKGDDLSVEDAIATLRVLDARLPRVRNVVIRGLEAGAKLNATRQFRQRSNVYLTNFYTIAKGELLTSSEQAKKAAICVIHTETMLVQTPQIRNKLREVTGIDFRSFELPPPIPDDLPMVRERTREHGVIRIGYAGKITPDWGIVELLDWAATLTREGLSIELHIAANKISESSCIGYERGFSSVIKERMTRLGAFHYQDLNRDSAMQLMSEMNYVWCWRPERFENLTLELSTKLVEMAASGAKCICYPSQINRLTLGDDYPYYARSLEDVRHIVSRTKGNTNSIPTSLREKHSISNIQQRLEKEVINRRKDDSSLRICVAGHDFKFIDPFISYLKATGHEVIRDEWQWGEAIDVTRSRQQQEWADIVFCEWGLANAVWYSSNLRPGKKLYIRVHLQEVSELARKFGYQIKIENVEKIIFVAEEVKNRAQELFGWPEEKLVVIPNFVLTNEYSLIEREPRETINLGMVGIIPKRKRFDRAVDTLAELRRRGHKAKLYIKGPRPETLEFMYASGRKHELEYYDKIYARIDADPLLTGNVIFEPWGNDVALWYRKIDHIISCSDFESFHYALADGVLTGCHPIVWPWEGADKLYTKDWLIEDVRDAVKRIEKYRILPSVLWEERAAANRELVEKRYGHEKIFRRLLEVIGVMFPQCPGHLTKVDNVEIRGKHEYDGTLTFTDRV